jgi:hypothetical protein
MTVPARITLVTLAVKDLARATRFYEALGWKRSSIGGDEVSFFATAGSVLALYRAELLAADLGVERGDPPVFRWVELAINVENEAEVDRVLGEAESAGGVVLKPGARADWGGYTGHFADPEGHAWEVAYNPGFTIAADGSIVLPD